MDMPLDEIYLRWLYSQVSSVRLKNPNKTHWNLLRQLLCKEFVWFVPNDDNRVEDGRELRREFLVDLKIREVDPDWMLMGCSVLEMLIALSRRIAFEESTKPSFWFWKLIDNLGLTQFNDAWYLAHRNEEVIDDRLDTLIFRTYAYDGSQGGLFPLKYPNKDQRTIEIWYQMCAYILEQGE